jgi:hypothetical protein
MEMTISGAAPEHDQDDVPPFPPAVPKHPHAQPMTCLKYSNRIFKFFYAETIKTQFIHTLQTFYS